MKPPRTSSNDSIRPKPVCRKQVPREFPSPTRGKAAPIFEFRIRFRNAVPRMHDAADPTFTLQCASSIVNYGDYTDLAFRGGYFSQSGAVTPIPATVAGKSTRAEGLVVES